MKNLRLEAVVMALGLVLMGLMIRGGINDFKDKERIVSVKGLAEMEVPADKVIWPLVYKELGNDPVSIYNKIAEKNAAVVKYLKQNGVAEEEISIAPAEIIDMEADRYASQNVAYRYNATSVITVTSKNVDLIRKLITKQTELLKQVCLMNLRG